VLVQRGFNERREAQAGRSGALPQRTAVIRGGDRVILEEHTPVVDARLEAIALAPAREGGTLRVRLKIGGGIVEAVALGPGRVAFAAETEARP
jgi:flagella basal body P-ring formation protein FlgA